MKIRYLAVSVFLTSLSFNAAADDFQNNYILAGLTINEEHQRTMQGINLEYLSVDYTQHWEEHKHLIGGYGISFNRDSSKFEEQFSRVREATIYKKNGIELFDDSNFYALGGLGAGLYETTTPKKDDDTSSGESIQGQIDEDEVNIDDGINDDNNNENEDDEDPTIDNDFDPSSNKNKDVILTGQISTGFGYYSRDGQYAASVEFVGQYYEKKGFDKSIRIMFGWQF